MTINKQALELVGVTVDEYLQWCSSSNFPSYRESTKKEFFKRINENRIVRDTKTGLLINKNSEDKNEE